MKLSEMSWFGRIADKVTIIVDPTHFPPVFMPSLVSARSGGHTCRGYRIVHTLSFIAIH